VIHTCILATREAESKRIVVQGQPRKIVCEIPSPKEPEQNGVEVWLKSQSAYFASTCFARAKP
jgi:hypothetical protein